MPQLSGVSSSVLINIREDTPAAPPSAAEPRPPLSRGQAAAICWCRRYRAAAKVLTIVAQAHTPYTELITAIPEIAAAERVTTSVDAHRPKLTWLSAGVDMVIGRQRCRHRPTLMNDDHRDRPATADTHGCRYTPRYQRAQPRRRASSPYSPQCSRRCRRASDGRSGRQPPCRPDSGAKQRLQPRERARTGAMY